MTVSLTEMKAHLRVLSNDEDALITSLIAQAEEAASDYCRVEWGNETNVPEPVRLAIMLMVSHFFECRDSSDRSAYITMKEAFQMLLYPHRKPESLF